MIRIKSVAFRGTCARCEEQEEHGCWIQFEYEENGRMTGGEVCQRHFHELIDKMVLFSSFLRFREKMGEGPPPETVGEIIFFFAEGLSDD